MKSLILFIFCIIFLQSCVKDSSKEDTKPSSNSNCQLTKITWIAGDYDFTDGTPIVNTLQYKDSLIVSMVSSNGNSYNYRYDGTSFVQRRNYYNQSGQYQWDSINYNTNNLVIVVSSYKTQSQALPAYEDDYTYDQNNRLIKIEETTWVDQNGNSIAPIPNGYPLFYYDNAGNLTHVVRYSSNGIKYLEYYYSYTNQPNYLATKFKNLQLIDFGEDNFSRIFYDVMYTSPLLLNTIHYIEYNNQDSSKVDKDKTINISYDLNKSGYPTLIKADGESIIGFEYNCK